MTDVQTDRSVGVTPGRRAAPRWVGELTYCLLDLPLSLLFFVPTIAVLVLGIGTAVVYVGLPIGALALLYARATGGARRTLVAGLLGERLSGPPPLQPRRPGAVGRIAVVWTDGDSWRAVMFHCLSIVLGPLRFVTAVGLYLGALGGVSYPLWYRWLPLEEASDGTLHRGAQWWPDYFVDTWPRMAVLVAAGVLLLAVAPRIVRVLTDVERGLARGLLSGPTS